MYPTPEHAARQVFRASNARRSATGGEPARPRARNAAGEEDVTSDSQDTGAGTARLAVQLRTLEKDGGPFEMEIGHGLCLLWNH